MNTIERIDFLIKRSGLSRRKLAIKANIPPSSLQSAMERGNMKMEMLEKIARAFGISPADLYDWSNDSGERQRVDRIDDSYMESCLFDEFDSDAIEGFLKTLLSFGYVTSYIDGNFHVRKSMWTGDRYEREKVVFIVPDSEMRELIQKQLSYAKFNLQEVLENVHCFYVQKENTAVEAPPAPTEAAPTPPEEKDQGGGENA